MRIRMENGGRETDGRRNPERNKRNAAEADTGRKGDEGTSGDHSIRSDHYFTDKSGNKVCHLISAMMESIRASVAITAL